LVKILANDKDVLTKASKRWHGWACQKMSCHMLFERCPS